MKINIEDYLTHAERCSYDYYGNEEDTDYCSCDLDKVKKYIERMLK